MFFEFCKQWINAQLTHHVSLEAASVFWKLAFQFVSDIEKLKENEGIKKKIPQFQQIRKTMYKDHCPEVQMSFAFLNNEDDTIIKVKGNHTPLKLYQRDPKYQKLYEEAHIEVSHIKFNITDWRWRTYNCKT